MYVFHFGTSVLKSIAIKSTRLFLSRSIPSSRNLLYMPPIHDNPNSPKFLCRIAVLSVTNGEPLKLSSNRSAFFLLTGHQGAFFPFFVYFSSKYFVKNYL